MRWSRKRRPRFLPRRFGRSPAGSGERRSLFPGGHNFVGHRVRWGQPSRGLHQDIEVRAVDTQECHLAIDYCFTIDVTHGICNKDMIVTNTVRMIFRISKERSIYKEKSQTFLCCNILYSALKVSVVQRSSLLYEITGSIKVQLTKTVTNLRRFCKIRNFLIIRWVLFIY